MKSFYICTHTYMDWHIYIIKHKHQPQDTLKCVDAFFDFDPLIYYHTMPHF